MLLNANLYLYVYIQLQLLYVFNIVINVNLIFNNASMLTSFSYAKSAIHFWHFCHFLFSFCVFYHRLPTPGVIGCCLCVQRINSFLYKLLYDICR